MSEGNPSASVISPHDYNVDIEDETWLANNLQFGTAINAKKENHSSDLAIISEGSATGGESSDDGGSFNLKKKPTLKNVGSVNQQTRTCAWLKEQNWAKRVLFCQRRFYREEGFPAIPSAYSACPKTCKWFVGRNANPKNRLGE